MSVEGRFVALTHAWPVPWRWTGKVTAWRRYISDEDIYSKPIKYISCIFKLPILIHAFSTNLLLLEEDAEEDAGIIEKYNDIYKDTNVY